MLYSHEILGIFGDCVVVEFYDVGVGRDLHRVARKIGKAAKHISNWNIWNKVLLKVKGIFIGMVQ